MRNLLKEIEDRIPSFSKGQKLISAYILENYDKATYSFAGAALMRFGIPCRRRLKFTCSQFVAVCLSKAEGIKLPKDPWLMYPHDFPNIEGIRKIYDGKIRDCNFSEASVFK